MSDPVDGKFRIASTADGGKSWKVLPNAGMPAALTDEFAFAASGTCLVAGPGRTAWFATGGGDRPRVFRTYDGGVHWKVSDSPMASGAAAGIFSLAFRGSNFGVAVGGDFLKPTEAVDAASVTYDGGRSWKLVPADKAPKGYRSGSAFVPWSPGTVVAVGPSGSDFSLDGGRSWTQFYDGSFDSVECAGYGYRGRVLGLGRERSGRQIGAEALSSPRRHPYLVRVSHRRDQDEDAQTHHGRPYLSVPADALGRSAVPSRQ